MSAKLPRLLDSSLREVARVTPTAMSAALNLESLSTAQITLAEDAPAVRMHDWFEVFTPAGSAGMFRVTAIDDTKRQERVLTLTHGFDTLGDSVWRGQTDYDGTVAGFVAAVLAQQPVTRWQLGTCADTGEWKRAGINYDHLSDLLEEVREARIDYYFDYDFTTSPWTLNIRAKTNAVTSEFRLARNVETCRISYSDSEQCNRLYLSVNHRDDSGEVTVTDTEIKTYNNTASQALYGIIEKTADIDLEDVPDADAWAADFLRVRADPAVAISIDGYALKALTGLEWDEAKLGELSRVALPDYGATLEERVVSVSYPEISFSEGSVDRVTVELANRLEKFSEAITQIGKEASKAAKAGRSAARGGGSGSVMEQWSMVLTKHGETLDGAGVSELYESGIIIDPVAGTRIFSLYEGYVATKSWVDVQASRIDLVVQGEGAEASIKIAAIVDGINDASSQITISADKIYLDGNTTIDNLLTGRTAAAKIWATDSQFGRISLMYNGQLSMDDDPIFSFERKYVTWQSKSVITGAGSNPSTTLSDERWFVYANNNDTNDLRTVKGKIVTSYSGGSAASSDTIYYLGRAQA